MLLTIKVIPNAKQNRIEKTNEVLKVYVKSRPIKGKANMELIKLLAEYFGVSKTDIRIVKGEKSREKVVEIIKPK